jgi:hypothetical protein
VSVKIPEKLSSQPMINNVQASKCNPKSNFACLLKTHLFLRYFLLVFDPFEGEEEEDLCKG